VALADSWTEKVELHAIQMGSAWQIEVWWPVSELRLHQAVPDVVRLKQSLEQIERLAGEIPSLYRYALLTRAAYLRAHGDIEGALALDEQVLASSVPRSFLGWTSLVGEIAALYNARGDYQSAQLIAAQALSQYTGDDRDFIVITLVAEVEWAVATAALGGVDEAVARLQALLDYFATTENPLVLGTLHHGRARVALLAGDRDTYAEQLMLTRRWFERTENPALIAFVEALAQRGRGSVDDTNAPPPNATAGGETVRVRR
jgi:tetratricopeptide (TPR) repeat protein